MAAEKGGVLWGEGLSRGSKEGLGLGRSIERGRDIPVGKADLVQEETEELGKLGNRPDHSEKSNGPMGHNVVADRDR